MTDFSDQYPFMPDPLESAVEASYQDRESQVSSAPIAQQVGHVLAAREAHMSLLEGHHEQSHARYARMARIITNLFSR